MLKICSYCGKEFEAKYKNKLYCSDSCKVMCNSRKRAGIKRCKECDKEFQPSKPCVEFCSTSCSSKYNHRSAYKMVICKECGVEFEFKGTTSPKFCTECRKHQNSLQTMKSRVKLGIQDSSTVGIGKGGWQKKGDNTTVRHRNGIHQREKMYYKSCLIRFKCSEKCVVCGDEDNIHVHHIDHDPNNNDENNLVFLCQSCHTKHHKKKTLTTEHILECINIVLKKLRS